MDQTELEYWKAECREVNEKLCFLQKQLLRGRSGSFTSQVEGAEEGGGELEHTRALLSGVRSELAAREEELGSTQQEVERLRSKVREGVEALKCREKEWQSERARLQKELDLLRSPAKDRKDHLTGVSAGEAELAARVTQLEGEVQHWCSQASALEREVARLRSQLEASAATHQTRVEELEQALRQEREGGGGQKVAELLRRVDGLQQEKDKALADLAAIKKARKASASSSAASSDGSASPAPPHSTSTGLSAHPDVGALSTVPSLALPRKSEPSVGVAKVEFVPGGFVCMCRVGGVPPVRQSSRLTSQHQCLQTVLARLMREPVASSGPGPSSQVIYSCMPHTKGQQIAGQWHRSSPLSPAPAEPKAAPREYLEPWQIEHPKLRPIPLMAGEGHTHTHTHARTHTLVSPCSAADTPSPKLDHPSQEVLDKLFRKPAAPALAAASSFLKRLRPVNAASS